MATFWLGKIEEMQSVTNYLTKKRIHTKWKERNL